MKQHIKLVNPSWFKYDDNSNNDLSFKDMLNNTNFKNSLSNLTFIVGYDRDKNVVIDNLKDCKSIFIAGASGAGKTSFLHSLIVSLLSKDFSNNRVELIDPKYVELECFDGIPNFERVCEMSEIKEKLKSIKEEIAKREKTNSTCHNIILVVDEIADMLCYDKDLFVPLYTFIVKHGPNVGVYPVFTTQALSRDFITKDFIDLFATKIAFHLFHERESQLIELPNSENLSSIGECYYSQNGKIQHLQSGYICYNDLQIIQNNFNS